jgi:hypothetical protein
VKRVAILGAGAVAAAELGDVDEVIVLDPSPDALLAALAELADPRFAFQLGGLPVLPLPDGWVDEVDGVQPGDPELDRVCR